MGGAASHATSTQCLPPRIVIQSQELSRDMLIAAATAENNLR